MFDFVVELRHGLRFVLALERHRLHFVEENAAVAFRPSRSKAERASAIRDVRQDHRAHADAQGCDDAASESAITRALQQVATCFLCLTRRSAGGRAPSKMLEHFQVAPRRGYGAARGLGMSPARGEEQH